MLKRLWGNINCTIVTSAVYIGSKISYLGPNGPRYQILDPIYTGLVTNGKYFIVTYFRDKSYVTKICDNKIFTSMQTLWISMSIPKRF